MEGDLNIVMDLVVTIIIIGMFQIQHGAEGDEGGGVVEPHLCHLVCLGRSPQLRHWYHDYEDGDDDDSADDGVGDDDEGGGGVVGEVGDDVFNLI